MSSTTKTQIPQYISNGLPIPDPWDFPLEASTIPSIYPRQIPLDPSHELAAAAQTETILLGGLPETLKLPERAGATADEIAILLTEELKLGQPMDEPLRDRISTAIAYLELVN